MAVTAVRFLSPPEEDLPPSLELAGVLYLPDIPKDRRLPGLVVGHGAGSRASNHAEFCMRACKQGFAVLALDFRGHGDSRGEGDGPLELDILAAARLLRSRADIDPRRVCYRGSSMGGFYGLKSAPEAGFAALVLLCPAREDTMLASIDRAAAGKAAESPARWDSPRLRAYFQQQDSYALAERVTCPVLLVHARGDEVVPIKGSFMLAQHLRSETTILALEGGSHTSAQHDPGMHAYTAAWLWSKV